MKSFLKIGGNYFQMLEDTHLIGFLMELHFFCGHVSPEGSTPVYFLFADLCWLQLLFQVVCKIQASWFM